MFKFFSALKKEWLILARDIAGLIVLFIMPMVMVVMLALIQEFGWNSMINEPKIPVIYVDEDQDSLSHMIGDGLRSSHLFQVVSEINGEKVTEDIAREKVRKGEYQIGVVIPKGATATINRKIQVMVTQFVSGIMMPLNNPFLDIQAKDSVHVVVFFDPTIKGSFKNTFLSSLKEYSLKIESSMIFKAFNYELTRMFPQYKSQISGYSETVFFDEEYPSGNTGEAIPTSTQHNVPSWAIFAMFFIVIPLTSSIIKEREEGSLIRLHTLPVSYITIFMAKVGVYLIVCIIQFILMVLAGMFILPMFGLPPLEISNYWGSMIIMAIVSALAALGYGIMVGTIARTHQQAAAFGSVSVVILAAMGGLWVPTYLMPGSMKVLATFSPLNWAQAGFMEIFLRGGHFYDLLPYILKLLLFFGATMMIAGIYKKFKPQIRS